MRNGSNPHNVISMAILSLWEIEYYVFTDRQTYRQTDRHSDGQLDPQTYMYVQRQTYRLTDKQTE
jgi:hypothetical protein